MAEAVNSLLRILSGYVSDRWTRRRPIVIAGYLLSSAARPFIAATTTWTEVLLVRSLDRTGKGIRGAPRDAMLAWFAPGPDRGRLFGFHRAMDHTGAIAGPLVASAVLWFAPAEYRLVFVLTLIPGAVAVALLFFVPEPGDERGRSAGLSQSPAAPMPPASRRLPRPLRTFLTILLVFSLGNSTDAFLLLRVSEALGSATFIPLLWSVFHIVKASLSTWGGALSDRLGRKRAIVVGWLIYTIVYVGFATGSSARALIAWFLVYGVYFALTEGAERALVADLVPADRHGAAFGIYNAALGAGALAASVLFGVLYEQFGVSAAFGTGAGLAATAAVALVLVPIDTGRGVKIESSDASNSRHQ